MFFNTYCYLSNNKYKMTTQPQPVMGILTSSKYSKETTKPKDDTLCSLFELFKPTIQFYGGVSLLITPTKNKERKSLILK